MIIIINMIQGNSIINKQVLKNIVLIRIKKEPIKSVLNVIMKIASNL